MQKRKIAAEADAYFTGTNYLYHVGTFGGARKVQVPTRRRVRVQHFTAQSQDVCGTTNVQRATTNVKLSVHGVGQNTEKLLRVAVLACVGGGECERMGFQAHRATVHAQKDKVSDQHQGDLRAKAVSEV